MSDGLADAIGYLAATLTATMSILQALRIRRHGVEGVSSLTWTTAFTLMCFWLAYGIGTGLIPIVVGNIVCPLAVAYTLWCIGAARVLRPLALSTVTTAAICGIPVIVWGWDAGLPGAALISIGLCVPQIVDLYGTRTAAGVSARAWIVGSISVFVWVAYGVGIERWSVVIVDLIVLGANVLIAALAVQRHRTLRLLEAASA